jgi:alpha-L-rhamnosidase
MTRSIRRTLSLLAFPLVHSLHADVPRSLQSSMIWSPSAPVGTQAYVALRKEFQLAAVPAGPALLHLFADSRYLLWVNGNQILRGPSRFHPKGPEYDSLDIRPYLQSGTNSLVVMVHHYAGATSGRIMRHAPGLTALLEADGKEILRSDASWKSSNATEYRPSPDAWSSIPDVIDARLSPGAWTTSGFDDSAWTAASPVDGSSWGALQARHTPLPAETVLTNVKKLPGGEAIASVLPIDLRGPAASIILDLGKMAMAYPKIQLDADDGSTLQIQYALRYVDGQPQEMYGTGTTYTARAGPQELLAADQWCARYVTITCTSGRVRISGLQMNERRYPYERLGSFQCSDPMLTQLWEMAVNTIEATTDDAHGSDARERNEWVQDGGKASFNTIRIAAAGPDGKGGRVYSDPRTLRKLLRDSAHSQLPDGRMLGTFPTDRGDHDPHYVIEDYALQWVESLRWYHELTGDTAFVREMWPTLVAQMQWFLDRITDRGLLNAREYTSFDNPLAYITCEGANINAFFYQALRDAAYLGAIANESTQTKTYSTAADALHTAYNARLWNADKQAYSAGFHKDGKLGPTVHAQLLALYSGLVPDDRLAATRAWFLANYKNPGSGIVIGPKPNYLTLIANKAGLDMPIMYYWAFTELYRADTAAMDQEAISEMRRRWKNMVHFLQDAGTLSESFVNDQGGGMHESCHNYGAIPAYFLSSFVLGPRVTGPHGNRRLLIEPRPADLTYASGTVVTDLGPVPVSWTKHDGKFDLSCTIPPGKNATLHLPITDGKVTVNGVEVENAASHGRYVILPLSSGSHHVTAHGTATHQ